MTENDAVDSMERGVGRFAAPVSQIEAKMPKFLPDQPAMFFVIAEAQFTLRNVRSDEAKYAHVTLFAVPSL